MLNCQPTGELNEVFVFFQTTNNFEETRNNIVSVTMELAIVVLLV